jgi:hypothetical protein
MAAIAEGSPVCLLAAAEIFCRGFVGFPGDRRKFRPLVRTVAEGLVRRLSAGTPEIGLSFDNIDGKRLFAGNLAFEHEFFSLILTGTRHAKLPSGKCPGVNNPFPVE